MMATSYVVAVVPGSRPGRGTVLPGYDGTETWLVVSPEAADADERALLRLAQERLHLTESAVRAERLFYRQAAGGQLKLERAERCQPNT